MSLSKFQILNPDPILERTSQEEGTVARIAHVNNLIDQLNTSFGYDVLGLNIVAGANGSITPDIQGVGARGTAGNATNGGCRAGTQPYTYSNGTTGCINATLRTVYSNYLPVIARTGTGVYTFTFPVAPPFGYDILLSPPAVLNGTRISVVKTSSTVFTITVTDAGGGPADNLLNNMYLEVKIYN